MVRSVTRASGFEEPSIRPVARPDLAARFPLVLTCAKPTLFLQTQRRALPGLRGCAHDPEVGLHPINAAMRGIAAGTGSRWRRRPDECASVPD